MRECFYFRCPSDLLSLLIVLVGNISGLTCDVVSLDG